MDGTGALLADFVSALAPEFEAIVVSYPNDPAMGYAELEAVARARLPVNQPFFLLGESFSGPIAISIAASEPVGLQGLILCCSFARNPRPTLGWLRSFVQVLPTNTPVLSHWLLFGRFSSERLRTALARALSQVAPATLRARLAAVLSIDACSKLAKVRVPVLYLRASEDRVVPPSASALVARALPATGVMELEGPHFLLQVSPGAASLNVKVFAQGVAVGP